MTENNLIPPKPASPNYGPYATSYQKLKREFDGEYIFSDFHFSLISIINFKKILKSDAAFVFI
jgi:hypothetical protein